ncbi:MAG: cobaltochelatase subunit CobT, partial [Parasphingorhabdus sp.]
MLDCSGSMRGGSLVSAIAGLRAAGDAFEKEGRPFEILGFTTDKWKGGRSREDWREAGRPQLPGRLNDLLHINIKRFDEDWTQASKNMVG